MLETNPIVLENFGVEMLVRLKRALLHLPYQSCLMRSLDGVLVAPFVVHGWWVCGSLLRVVPGQWKLVQFGIKI